MPGYALDANRFLYQPKPKPTPKRLREVLEELREQVEHPQRSRSVSAEQHALPLAEREAESRRELRLVRVAVGLAVRCVVGSGAQLAWLGLRLGLGVRLG